MNNSPRSFVVIVTYSKVFVCVLFLLSVTAMVDSDCNLVTRSEWGAREPNHQIPSLNAIPPHYVVIHHSATRSCNDTESCKQLLKSIQNYHMDDREWCDIGYNFLVGGDGKIYEGRGYTNMGAHAIPYNRRSLGICLLGTFTSELPNNVQLEAVKGFIECAVENVHLASDYHLLGHRQATATECPGQAFYDEIKTWSHFDPNPE